MHKQYVTSFHFWRSGLQECVTDPAPGNNPLTPFSPALHPTIIRTGHYPEHFSEHTVNPLLKISTAPNMRKLIKIYTARAYWDDGWWTITVDELDGLVTTTRLLEQIPAAVTSWLMNLPEKPIDYPEDALVLVLPEMATEPLLHPSPVNEQTQLTRELRAKGLTFRDIGSLLTIDAAHAARLARQAPPT